MQVPLLHHVMSNTLAIILEAILFYKGGAVTQKELAGAAGASIEEVTAALEELKSALVGRGIQLVMEGTTVALATAPEASAAIEAARREEMDGPLGRAGLETLAVIMYRGSCTRADIEYIRGVNASSILRSLMIRGLVERVDNPKDKRSFLYQATAELPAYLGVSSIKELPEFAEVGVEIEAVFKERDKAVAEAPTEE